MVKTASYKSGSLVFALVTYENGLKTSLAGGSLVLEGKTAAVCIKNTPQGECKPDMFIYENGIFVF